MGYNKNKKLFEGGQVVLEYTMCIVILLLIFYGCLMAFRWAGLSLANKRVMHERSLRTDVSENWIDPYHGPLAQVNPNFDPGTPMNLIFNRW